MGRGLKTLKDIDPEPCCHGIRERELKEEAIKWIRDLRLESKKEPKARIICFDFVSREALHYSATRETFNFIQELWIMKFFNIKEEELKDDNNNTDG